MSIATFKTTTFPTVGDTFASAEEFKDAYLMLHPTKVFSYSSGTVHPNKYKTVRTENSRKRVKVTMTGTCDFFVRAVLPKKNGDRWIVKSHNDVHNHDMLEDDEKLCLVNNRKLHYEQQRTIEEMHVANVKTSAIVAAVNNVKCTKTRVIAKDITNQRALLRSVLNEGENQHHMNPFIRNLEEKGYTLSSKYEENGRLTHLFLAHVSAVNNIRQCPEVLLVDATYRTSMFGYPLINAIGVADETKVTYEWFFETLKTKQNARTLPEVIITDRAASVRSALDNIFQKSIR
ncbi:hypothetical protein INT47_012146 [Mucor saturninus]|uniref:Protein FAR1-RELATED SEQUENCE n=1 Tax=Mucor saturninus TaxID=64648 RepID=A0A8H7QK72_9FUNG|nr:hypothetical protein INT47_012146 [Mucor saturninus]